MKIRWVIFFISLLSGLVSAADVTYEFIDQPALNRMKVLIKIKSLELSEFESGVYYPKEPCGYPDRRCYLSPYIKSPSVSVGGPSVYSRPNLIADEAFKEIVSPNSPKEIAVHLNYKEWEKIISERPTCLVFAYFIVGPLGASTDSCSGALPPLPLPDPISCTMDNIELQHGVVSISDVNGHQSSKSVFIRCNGNGSGRVAVNVSVLNNGRITLDNEGHLKSQIYINGSAGGKSMTIPNNGTSVNIMSMLVADSDAELNGSFRKSSVIVLNIL